MTKLKENLFAFIGAVILTVLIIFSINMWSNNLASSILWEKNKISISSDLSFKYNSWTAILYNNKKIENVASVSLEMLFNPQKVTLSRNNINSQYSLSLAKKQNQNWYDVLIQNIWSLNKKNKILEIDNITKKQFDNINIGHIQVIDNNGRVLNLSSDKK